VPVPSSQAVACTSPAAPLEPEWRLLRDRREQAIVLEIQVDRGHPALLSTVLSGVLF
jgi:hypothetical protein